MSDPDWGATAMKQHYYCAYGHVARWSIKVENQKAAAKDCFGMTDRVTCLAVGTRDPRYFSQKKKTELYEVLKKIHNANYGEQLE